MVSHFVVADVGQQLRQHGRYLRAGFVAGRDILSVYNRNGKSQLTSDDETRTGTITRTVCQRFPQPGNVRERPF